ncbi:MAG: cytochrome c oxidase accessory protein CcoG [Azoarcus sp.]|jgi:cytochrome c oxidase accessory protein FixG|nr:cytochrome c oxidase accessory protein CcoG [Azoarcus sp.]
MSDSNPGNTDTPVNDSASTSPTPATAAPQAKKKKIGGLYEKHNTIYVRAVEGRFVKWRWALVWLTQIIFLALPWLTWNGRQAVLLHLVERKFYIFGWVFWPQDVFFLAIILIISAYSLFFFTAIAGRLWCGYACPQTVYTEIFLWIEQKIEGDHAKRAKLDAAPMDGRKFRIKSLKHLIWLLFSLWTGFTLVAYFSPLKELLAEAPTFSFGPWETFWIFFYGGFTYLFAGFMREQVCKFMCPYARFQSAMFDQDTLIITYDEARGEPRGVKRKGDDTPKGDCVDCGICVQVCPTGIDIRHGLQYECIGCAACVDACDEVMLKMNKPVGLVRYTTEHAMKEGWSKAEILKHVRRPRTMIYGAILLLIFAAFLWGLSTRTPLRVDVIRDRASLGQEIPGGLIENVFMLRVMNMTEKPRSYTLEVTGLDGLQVAGENRMTVNAAQTEEFTLPVHAPQDAGQPGANRIFFEVVADDDPNVKRREKATFFFPADR